MRKRKILIIRFSSIGDVTQSLSIAGKLALNWPDCEVHWVTREDLSCLLIPNPNIHKVYELSRKSGFVGLLKLALKLRREKFTHIYDAHNNLRSFVISLILKWGTRKIFYLRKSQKRWQRFLLFQFRKNLFKQPFSGQRDLLEPLISWGMDDVSPPVPQLFIKQEEMVNAKKILNMELPFIALAPSAAFPLKRWPKSHWENLIKLENNMIFVLLGGPEDTFLQQISDTAPERTINLAGKLSLKESAAIIKLSQLLISNDTGLLHFAEQLGHPCIALMAQRPLDFPLGLAL